MKLAIVGLDGLSENMISECRADLPVLNRLLSEGAGGTLQSTLPPVTLPAWTTFSTGKNPGKHGLYNMTEITADYEAPATSANTSEGALYDAIDDSVFIHLQASYGRKPNGDALLIPADAPSKEAALPDEVQEWEESNDYRVTRDADLDPDQYLSDLISISRARFKVAQRASQEYDPELMFVLFSSPDWLFHYLGSRGDESMIEPLMNYLDEVLGWFLENSDNLLIMSDHGFERKKTAAYPNKILENNGMLATEPPEDTSRSARLTVRLIKQFTKRSDYLHEIVRKAYNRLIHTEVAENLYQAKEADIDFTQTVAWHDGWGVVYLNREYFTKSNVSEVEYEDARQEVIDALSGSKHPDTGEPLFRQVLSGEEVYDGSAGVVPDIIIEPEPGVMLYQSPMQDKIASSTNIYNHRRDGIFAGIGEDFNSNSIKADIQDIAPTVLHMLDRPVPEDMDGKPLVDMLSESKPVQYGDPIEPGETLSRTKEEDEEIRGRLEDLGYLE